MADVIKKATNTFTKGLVMDFSPEHTQNEVLTNALNATLLTFNGNEMSLQNDMGNARVETAFLPEGYIPTGTCEYGGIIYIVSYNPLENKAQIGCFPSPERNISIDEVGDIARTSLQSNSFQELDQRNEPTGKIINTTQYVLLKDDKLNPGDKFIVQASKSLYNEALLDLYKNGQMVENPMLALHIVSIEDSGKIIYLNSEVRTYKNNNAEYHILGSDLSSAENSKQDIDAYRNVLSSGYNVFKSKTSGKLAILAELIMVDTYSVTHSIIPQENKNICDIVIHTEVNPRRSDSDTTSPQMEYHYLKHSQGYFQKFNPQTEQVPLFDDSGNISPGKLGDFYSNLPDDQTTITFGQIFNVPTSDHYTKCTYNNTDGVNTCADFKLATLTIPQAVFEAGIDLPFKYDYTLVPCMSYGILDHLAVSNTIDFSKLHDFNKSNFNTWKYRIDGEQLRLTVGAEIYDAYESDKVDALVLEFYDSVGFAGSLCISDKKSYSGVFNKILTLDTLSTLSSFKVPTSTSDLQSNIFSRNIAIQDNKFKEKDVHFNSKFGWLYNNDNTPLDISDNDCGTLYSNIVYGVKLYFKLSNGTYISKGERFLYTLPIFNDYYYTVNDFSTLENPELELVLTYKLADSSQIQLASDLKYTDGFTNKDYQKVSTYISGGYENDKLEITKYYQFVGTSKCQLEIGLHQKYESFALSCSPELNNIFSCKLKVVSNDSSEQTYQANGVYDIEGTKFGFGETYKSEIELRNIKDYNFITSTTDNSIPINYTFTVGYPITISNIVKTKVPATTICALYHKDDNGNWNSLDFGIRLEAGQYLSENMFYNSGTASQEVFGLCRQMTTDNGTMSQQCHSKTAITKEAQEIKTAGKLNTGEPLKTLAYQLGKLTFCQPHAHGLSETTGVNIHEGGAVTKVYGIPSNEGSWPTYGSSSDKETGYGIAPRSYLYDNPKYNLTLNTKNAILYNSEFISTLDYKDMQGQAWGTNTSNANEDHWVDNINLRIYTGLTSHEISTFNQKLLETMSSVYAYNPDYDYLNIYVGNTEVDTHRVQFSSNLVNTNSTLAFRQGKSLNDYIYLRSMLYSSYLSKLKTYSGMDTSSTHLQFNPNFTYCGTPENNYLLSTLTYNTPIPQDITSGLTVDSGDTVVVKHADGSSTRLSGKLNKRALYGYDKVNNKLIQLDVSNYNIDSDGVLTTSLSANLGSMNMSQALDELFVNNIERSDYTIINTSFIDVHGTKSDIKLGWILNAISLPVDAARFVRGKYLVIAAPHTYGSTQRVKLETSLRFISFVPEDAYHVVMSQLHYDLRGKVIKSELFSLKRNDSNYIGNIFKTEKDTDALFNLVSNNGHYQSSQSHTYWYNTDASNHNLNIQNTTNSISCVLNPYITANNDSQTGLDLYVIKFDKVDFVVTKIGKIANIASDIVNLPLTTTYSRINNHKYEVLPQYDSEGARTRIRGTSITLNDLVYEPTIDGHRLFVKNGCCAYDPIHRGKLYYRDYEDWDSWRWKDTKYLNNLYIYTGPCFTEDNL